MNVNSNYILVGLGGTGGKVLKAFKKRMFQEFSAEERAKIPVGFVYVDTTDEMMRPGDKTWYVLGENAQFNTNEFVFIKGVDLDQIFANPTGFPGLKGVIGDPEVMQKTIGNLGAAAGQKRRAGRILFGANVARYRQAVNAQYDKCKVISGNDKTTVLIFSGLAGGTGSGSIVDVVAQTRKMDQFNNEGTSIVVFPMIPEVTPPGGCDAGRYHANGYAALQELNALMVGAYKPFDLTGLSPTGRVEFGGIKRIANGLMVYSDVNENGYTVNPHTELPQIVSDFAFARVFMETNGNTEEYERSFSFENIDDWRTEYWEKAKSGDIVPYRTKALGSFGIKRIIIPDEEIKEYFTWTLGRQSLLQLRYNNWNDDIGFRDAPANVDWADYVKGQDKKLGNPLENWRFSDKHLMLDIPILPSDEGKWGTFQAYWGKVVPKWLEDAEDTSQPIAKLNELVAKGLQSGFRAAGVADFFAGKKEAREKIADEIVERIEADLFDKWAAGTFALYNLLELSEAIMSETQSKIKQFEDRSVKLRQAVDKLEQERQARAKEYNDAGLITRGLKGKQMLAGYAETMQKICVRKTEVEASGFALDLLKVLLGKENILHSRLEKFVSTVSDAIEEADRQAGSRCKDEVNTTSLEGTVIRYYDQPKVKEFTQTMVHSRKNQENISTAVRQEILKAIGSEKTFARANETIDQDVLDGIFEKTVREKVISIHDNTLVEASEKLINRSILEQLAEQYASADSLTNFARKIMKESGVMVKFNNTEVGLSVTNNPTTEIGKNVAKKVILVSLPKVEGNEKVQKFAADLKQALISAAEAGIKVLRDSSSDRKNEITVMNITYCLPMRTLESLKFYKERYDYLVNNPNMTAAQIRENKVILHGEGTGEQFPDLFLTPAKQKSQLRAEYTAWILLAYATGIIKYGDVMDGTGRKMFGTVEVDEDTGFETLKPLAAKFTEIGYADGFTEDFCENIKAQVEEKFKGPYLNIENRVNELRPKIQQLLNETLLPETGNNQGSKAFLEFLEAAKKAIQTLKN